MLNRETRQPFSPEAVFVAHRPFQCNGKNYAAGEDFPAAEVTDQRRLRKLYEARYISIKMKANPVESSDDEDEDEESTEEKKLSKRQLRKLKKQEKE